MSQRVSHFPHPRFPPPCQALCWAGPRATGTSMARQPWTSQVKGRTRRTGNILAQQPLSRRQPLGTWRPAQGGPPADLRGLWEVEEGHLPQGRAEGVAGPRCGCDWDCAGACVGQQCPEWASAPAGPAGPISDSNLLRNVGQSPALAGPQFPHLQTGGAQEGPVDSRAAAESLGWRWLVGCSTPCVHRGPGWLEACGRQQWNWDQSPDSSAGLE